MASTTVSKQLLGTNDLLLGTGTETQPRANSTLPITKINSSSIPYQNDTADNIKTRLDSPQADVVSELTSNAGVTVDGVLLKDNNIIATNITSTQVTSQDVITDQVSEETSNAGVTVDGLLIKDNTVTASDIITDQVSEETSNAGVTIDGLLIKDNTVTASDIITNQVSEETSNAGVTIDGLLIKDNTVTASDIITDQVSEETSNAGVTIDGLLIKDGEISRESSKSYLVAEQIYPHNKVDSNWSNFTQSSDGQWTWNNEPTATAGRHYFHNPNGTWLTSESILNPAIGAHLGGDRIGFRSLKKLDHNAKDGRPVYEVNEIPNVRIVGAVASDKLENDEDGINLDYDFSTILGKVSLELVGYYNDFKLLVSGNSSTYLSSASIYINGVNTSSALSVLTTSDSPLDGRYLPSNINTPVSGDMGITLGINTATIKSSLYDLDVFRVLQGVETIVNTTTLQIPLQTAVVQGKTLSLSASTPAYKPTGTSTDEGYAGIWDHADDIDSALTTTFNGGRVVKYLKPGSDTLQTKVNWMPANAKYQESFSFSSVGTKVNATNGQHHPSVVLIGSDYYAWYDDGTNIKFIACTSVSVWGNGSVCLSAGDEGNYDTTSASNPTVYYDGSSLYTMIYTGHNGVKDTLIYAESTDRTTWTGHELVIDIGVSGESDDSGCAKPNILRANINGVDTWFLYYAGYDGSKYRIHLATSTASLPDSTSDWTKHGVVLGLGVSDDLDDEAIEFVTVLYDSTNEVFKMWYGGQHTEIRILYATSKDGFTWAKHGLHVDVGANSTFNDVYVFPSSVIDDDTNYHLFYTAYDGSNHTLGYTSSPKVTGINQQTYGSYSNSINNGYIPEHHNLTMSDQEEIARVFHWREFGNGDVNGGTAHGFDTLSTSSSDRVFVLDDGCTGLVGDDIKLDSTSGGLVFHASSDTITFTFIGTGIAIEHGGWVDLHVCKIDGDSVYIPNLKVTGSGTLTLASNLPYGTHTLRLTRSDSATSGSLLYFIIFQPKQPVIEEGSVIVSDYMLFADPKVVTTRDVLNINKGSTRVDSSREFKYDGDSELTFTNVDVGSEGGNEVDGVMTNKQVYISFFGTGICVRHSSKSTGEADVNFSLSTDGGATFTLISTTNLGSNWGNSGSVYSSGTFDSDGTFSMVTGGTEYGHYDGVTGLSLDHYVVKLHGTTASDEINMSCVDIECPIGRANHYSDWKSRNPFYDELVGGEGLDTDDLIVGSDLLTKDEVKRGFKRDLRDHIYGCIWKENGDVDSGSIYVQNQVRGTSNRQSTANKGLIVDCTNGGYIISTPGFYKIEGFLTGYDGNSSVTLNGLSLQAINIDGSTRNSSPIGLGKIWLKRGDAVKIERSSGTAFGSDSIYNRLILEYLGDK